MALRGHLPNNLYKEKKTKIMNNSDSSLIFNNTAYIVILKALIPKFKLSVQ